MNNAPLIKEFANKISANFPSTFTWYEYNALSCTHFLLVEPVEIYDSKVFKEFGADLYFDWLKNGIEDEDFCLISSDSLTQLDQPELLCAPKNEFTLHIDGQEFQDVRDFGVLTDATIPCEGFVDFIYLIEFDSFKRETLEVPTQEITYFPGYDTGYSLAA